MNSPPDAWSVFVGPGVTAAVVSATVAIVTLWTAGRRDETRRRRELFAEAFGAYTTYREFPYVVRRRRGDQPEEERLRISEQLGKVQERINFYLAWTRMEDWEVGEAFEKLIGDLRFIAGPQIAKAWTTDPISSDAEMNIADIDLSGLKPSEDTYLDAVMKRVGRRRMR